MSIPGVPESPPLPPQHYQCNACKQGFDGPRSIGWGDRCPHCGSPPPFAPLLDLQPARSESSASMVLTTAVVTASAAIGVARFITPESGEYSMHGPGPDLVALVRQPHHAEARPHLDPFSAEPLLVLVLVGTVAGTAYAGRQFRYYFKSPQP